MISVERHFDIILRRTKESQFGSHVGSTFTFSTQFLLFGNLLSGLCTHCDPFQLVPGESAESSARTRDATKTRDALSKDELPAENLLREDGSRRGCS